MPCRIWTDSNPVTTRGIELVDRAKGRQARDGGDVARLRIKPSMAVRVVGDGASRRRRGLVGTIEPKKFESPRASVGLKMAAAMVGVVVSKPTPIKMTDDRGFCFGDVGARRAGE